uniref:PID domain-containing protein n=1 Tax=Gasterosteus aculeatus aculeatus TaxID=481459 RepID=A0AAQ4PMU6_GASAC
GFEAAARRQGRHKLRVWLKVSQSGLKIVDERTGAVLHEHHRSRISSLKTDESDPRALAYVYQHLDTCSLFYIRTANRAEPVLLDIEEVCQTVDQETPEEAKEATTQVRERSLQWEEFFFLFVLANAALHLVCLFSPDQFLAATERHFSPSG